MISDFLIIGGGIAGISAAARLSHIGKVTVLEAEANLAHHASSRSAAMFLPHYGPPAIVALSNASADYLHKTNGGVLSPRGLLTVAGPKQGDVFKRETAAMAQRQISVAEGVALFPILNPKAVGFAGYSEAGWDLDTDLLIQNFAREARGNGASFQTNARVTGLERTAAGWLARTADGEYSGSVLINAAGAWVNVVAELARISSPQFMPLRRSMARIPAPGGLDVSSWPLVDGAGEGWYAKPDAGALIVSPAEEFLMEPHDAWADDMVLAEGLARYEAMVTEPVTRLLSSWAGLRTFSPDRTPVVGRDSADPTFFWLAGQGGYGFQSAPAISQLVADLLAARPSELDKHTVAALSPARFV